MDTQRPDIDLYDVKAVYFAASYPEDLSTRGDRVAKTFGIPYTRALHLIDKMLRADWEELKRSKNMATKEEIVQRVMDEVGAEPTDSELITLYLTYRDWCASEAKRFKEHVEPVQTAMEDIEAMMHARLLERNSHSTSGEDGSAFFVTNTSITCVDKNEYLGFCVKHFDTWGKDLLTAAVSKETAKLYIERAISKDFPEGYPPPGLKAETSKTVQFRRGG